MATTVAGLTQVQSDLTDLAGDVSALSTALNAIPTTDQSTAIADLATALSNTQADIDSLETLINSNQDLTEAQLDTISSTLAVLQTDVETLLQGDAVISPASGAIIITNEAQLGAAEAIVSANADPGSIVLDADLVVRVGTGFLTTQDQLDRINALLEKVATVIGDVTILNSPPEAVTAGVTADGLASAVGTMTLTGDDAVGLAGLVSVGGSLLMETTADPSFAALTSVGGNFERTSGGAPTVDALATVRR